MRILPPAKTIADNAQPIRLADSSYLILYQFLDAKLTDHPAPWTFTEIHLATGMDSYTWKMDPTIIGYGGTAYVVEAPDGTLFIYYVNR